MRSGRKVYLPSATGNETFSQLVETIVTYGGIIHPLSRRTILRGLGAAVSLPLLDAMVPAFALHPFAAPLRLAFIYVPNGILMDQWTPASDGQISNSHAFSRRSQPHRDNVLVLSGLTQNTGRALGDAEGDHARASATYLTGVHPKKTDGAGIRAGISVDQVAASHVGAATQTALARIGSGRRPPGRQLRFRI